MMIWTLCFIVSLVVFLSVGDGTQASVLTSADRLSGRRQVEETPCNSYVKLYQELDGALVSYTLSVFFIQIFPKETVNSAVILPIMEGLCRVVAEQSESLKTGPLAQCPSVLEDLETVSGLCTVGGNMTEFFTNLLADFGEIDTRQRCLSTLEPAYDTCYALYTELATKPLARKAYESKMKEHLKCLMTNIDQLDLTECGDARGWQRLSVMFDLLRRLRPGLTFTLTNVGLI